jgi:hypothetical protein
MDKKISIGRDASCDIRINDSQCNVSRNHATLHIAGSRIILEDHSSNGTWINAKMIHHSRMEVAHGDEILLGNAIRLSWSEINRYLIHSPNKKNIAWMLGGVGAIILIVLIIIVNKQRINDGSMLASNCKCRIFSPYPGEFTWDGDCLDSYANGYGTINWHSGKKYTGEIVTGHLSGEGKDYFNEQLVYEGEFRDGKWQGYGKLYAESGKDVIRKGYFENGKFTKEDELEDLCDKAGRAAVADYFNGGINIKTIPYAIEIAKRDEDDITLIFDLEFNGNYISSNCYSCRVVYRTKRAPQMELIEGYSNRAIRDLVDQLQVLGIFIGAANLINNIFE